MSYTDNDYINLEYYGSFDNMPHITISENDKSQIDNIYINSSYSGKILVSESSDSVFSQKMTFANESATVTCATNLLSFDTLYELYIDNSACGILFTFQKFKEDDTTTSMYTTTNKLDSGGIYYIEDSNSASLEVDYPVTNGKHLVTINKRNKQDLVSGVVQFEEVGSDENFYNIATYSNSELTIDTSKTYFFYRSRTASGATDVLGFSGQFQQISGTGTVLDGKIGFIEYDKKTPATIVKAVTFVAGTGLVIYDFAHNLADEMIYYSIHLNYLDDYYNVCVGLNGTKSATYTTVSTDTSKTSGSIGDIVYGTGWWEIHDMYINKSAGTYDTCVNQQINGKVDVFVDDIEETDLELHILETPITHTSYTQYGYIGNYYLADSTKPNTGEKVYLELIE